MAILVDDPIWHWRDRRWCHLVSDTSVHELHEFAARLDIPPRGFHGDHYDVPEEYRDVVVAAGAEPVSSRELLRRLRNAGLRLSPAQRRERALGNHTLADDLLEPT
ncbi:MAG: DUF4031 domain-containing protein [Actinomycetota bacterium]